MARRSTAWKTMVGGVIALAVSMSAHLLTVEHWVDLTTTKGVAGLLGVIAGAAAAISGAYYAKPGSAPRRGHDRRRAIPTQPPVAERRQGWPGYRDPEL